MARSGGFVWDETFTASGDLGSYQYYFVRNVKGQEGYVQAASSATAPAPLGILQNDPRDGEAATVRLLGRSKCVAGNTIGVGDFVVAASDGEADLAAGSTANGIALTAGTAGAKFEVLLGHFGFMNLYSVATDNTP